MAIRTWTPIQHAQKKYEPVFDYKNWDKKDWKGFKPAGKILNSGQAGENPAALCKFAVFPAMSSFGLDMDEILKPFALLVKSQKLYVAAEEDKKASTKQEINEASSPTSGKMSNKRRPSNAQQAQPGSNGHGATNGKGHFLGQ
ncbi:hypothetical protein N7470_003172 [Penicillium chermesinum]|nr:hypothetical protein N7470_003172 [Penicillium chermesinum]